MKTAKEIATECAKRKPKSYFSEPFEPHEWVIDAMEEYKDQAVKEAVKLALQIAAERATTKGSYLDEGVEVDGESILDCEEEVLAKLKEGGNGTKIR